MKKAVLISVFIVTLLLICTLVPFAKNTIMGSKTLFVSNFNESEKIEFIYDKNKDYNIYNEEQTSNINVIYPNTVSDAINNDLKTWSTNKIEDFKKLASVVKNNINKELKITFKEYNTKDKILSIKFDIYTNINNVDANSIETKTYNLETGESYFLNKITIGREEVLERLSEASKEYIYENKLNDKINDEGLIDKSLSPTTKNFVNFIVDDGSIEFVFEELKDKETNEQIPIIVSIENLKEIYKDSYPEIDLINYIEEISKIVEVQIEIEEVGEKSSKPGETIETSYNEQEKNPEIDPSKKYMAITFDDGPHPVFTTSLLNGLRERDVKATFFMVGERVPSNGEIIKQMREDGHQIGNHSYSHKRFNDIPNNEIEDQIAFTDNELKLIIDDSSTAMRPPYGIVNDNIIDICKRRNVPIVLWNVDPQDWKYRDSKVVADHIIEKAATGNIILLHDIYQTSVEGALVAIDTLKEEGYEFLTVEELISMQEKVEPGKAYNKIKIPETIE